jgi:uncharacterized protein Smg (DUF494 family)
MLDLATTLDDDYAIEQYVNNDSKINSERDVTETPIHETSWQHDEQPNTYSRLEKQQQQQHIN